MAHFSCTSFALTLSLFASIVVSCGKNDSIESEVATVVGRGGAFFDRRVQVLNALPNLVNGTTCLYISEYDKSKAPLFSGEVSPTAQQQEFLRQAERDARPVAPYPVSIADLDRGLAQKDVERRTRGILLIPTGIATANFGFGIVALGIAWSGNALSVLVNPFSWPYIVGGIGGIGLISQATRDLNSKNYGLRSNDAVAHSSASPARSNLGVTLAYINVSKSLPAASNIPCPSNLTSESVSPYVQSIQEQYNALTDSERSTASNKALAQLMNSNGCHFVATVDDEKLVYHAQQLGPDSNAMQLQTYRIKPNVGLQLLSDEEMKLQMKSDSTSGSKYIVDNERGSIAIWVSEPSKEKLVSAKLAHKVPSGAYLGGKSQLSGTCKIDD